MSTAKCQFEQMSSNVIFECNLLVCSGRPTTGTLGKMPSKWVWNFHGLLKTFEILKSASSKFQECPTTAETIDPPLLVYH